MVPFVACATYSAALVLRVLGQPPRSFSLAFGLAVRTHEQPLPGSSPSARGVEGQQIVAITDNLSTRGTENVKRWLEAHPRWRFQFTPTHASWLNQVEIFFSILWRRLLRHGIFTSEADLAQQMLAFVETYNQKREAVQVDLTGKVLEA